MTVPATTRGATAAMIETRVASPAIGVRMLLARLRGESERQVAFSEARLLFREAAYTIERLEAEVRRVTAELEQQRAEPRPR